ncbi:MAG: bis(5'-nucleosyl)-tetraphosphatase (symmetrical) [Candidatus Azotimanducaceae bacterium]|jgi:bis(5'-nucleosyl)-tetraphosphatase (symmetrical)
MSTYVIGDVQGCYDELQTLLATLKFNPQRDAVWFVGDLINRGPKNLETIRFIRDLPNSRVVLGNHDLHFLAVASGVQKPSPSDTLEDLLEAPDLADIIEWLRHLPLLHYDPSHNVIMVHAGLPPNWTLKTCLARALEVENKLTGPDYKEFLAGMYGNQPDIWTDDLAGMPRLRIITNYFTRLRYCNAVGKLELLHKTDAAPSGYAPWFTFPRAKPILPIVFGHWAALDGVTDVDTAIALDTGCVWGRRLTAMCIEDGRVTSVPAQHNAA